MGVKFLFISNSDLDCLHVAAFSISQDKMAVIANSSESSNNSMAPFLLTDTVVIVMVS